MHAAFGLAAAAVLELGRIPAAFPAGFAAFLLGRVFEEAMYTAAFGHGLRHDANVEDT